MAIVTSTKDIPLSCVRSLRPPVTTFSPSMWADTFSTFSFDDQEQETTYATDIEELKEEARSMLLAAKSSKLIILLIDTLERLALAYRFETEIETRLQQVYNDNHDHVEDYDLFTTALRFRLLRQHHYHVSCSVFDKFLGNDNKLDQGLISSDVEGLLSLYEAAHVRIHGEDVLEEATTFTRHHLTTQLGTKLESCLRGKVEIALENPLHRSVTIIQVPRYVSLYQRDETRDELLLKLAKLNFNFLQNVYKKELCDLTRWWNKFELKSKLPYARDRLIECYIWGVAIRFEPHYSYIRIAVTKCLVMATIVDDTYDNYATLAEAQLFTNVLGRWEMNESDGLPDCMKIVYRFVMSVYEDHEHETKKQEISFSNPSFQEAGIQLLCRSYNQELKWVMERKMPSYEAYTNNGVGTSCIYLILTSLVPGMKSATQETIDWVLSEPKILILAAKIGRLLNDLASHQRESKDGKSLTVMDCYTGQHGVSKQEALRKFCELVEDGWKDVNEEYCVTRSSNIPKEMVENIFNYLRIAEITYKNKKDSYTSPETTMASQIITSLFVDPIVI